LLSKGKTEPNYSWALEKFKHINKISPKVIVTDRELALMNSLDKVFPGCQNLLCIWHINKNIVAKCKPIITPKNWETSLCFWNTCISSITEKEFESN
jgi:hypothetical protein